MWAAFDDVRDPAYLSACLAAFRSRPDAVLACTEIRFIDEDGRDFEAASHLVGIRPTGTTPRRRLRQIGRAEHWYDFYGLGRAAAIRSTRGPIQTWGFDVVLLTEMCLLGPVVLVPRPLFGYRRFRAKSAGDLARTLAPSGSISGIPVCWSCLTVELLRAIWLSPYRPLMRLGLITSFVANFCLANRAVAASIRSDLATNIAAARRGRRWRLMALLLGLGALIYPAHNGLTRAIYRSVKRRSAGSQTPPAELSERA